MSIYSKLLHFKHPNGSFRKNEQDKITAELCLSD